MNEKKAARKLKREGIKLQGAVRQAKMEVTSLKIRRWGLYFMPIIGWLFLGKNARAIVAAEEAVAPVQASYDAWLEVNG